MAGEQDTLKLKIAKKAYIFDVRKRFSPTRSFAVKKKPETPAEGLKETLKEIFEKRKLPVSLAQASGAPAPGQAAAAAKPFRPDTPLILAGAIIALLILGLAAIMVLLPPGGASAPAQRQSGEFAGSYDFTVSGARVLSVPGGGEGGTQDIGYLLLGYSSSNLSALNFTVRLYQQKPATQVFLLDYPRDSGNSYPVFRRDLTEDLAGEGLAANEIEPEKLPSLPAGAVLVVPTGYFPEELLGSGGTFGYKDLLSRGTTIIYIGLPFDNLALGRDGLAVPVSYGEIAFDKSARPKSTGGFSLFDAQYAAAPGQGAQGGFGAGPTLYGSISSVHYGQGTLLFLPQSLDGGWRERDASGGWSEKGEQAAADVSRLIVEEGWLQPISTASTSLQVGGAGNRTFSLFTTPFSASSAYVEVAASATDLQGTARRSLEVFTLEKDQKGTVTPSDPQTVPFYLSGQTTRLNVGLRENSSSLVKLYVELYKDGKVLQRSDLEPGMTNPTTDKSVDIEVNAVPGDYVVLVSDAAGKPYAAGELSVTDLDIAVNSSTWNKGAFSFLLSSAGQPVEPGSVTISMDGKDPVTYSPASLSVQDTSTGVSYSYPDKINSGPHVFLFTAGPYSKSFPLSYDRVSPFWENPLVIVLGLLAAATFGAGMMLRRPETVRYGLDVPDFPPISTIKIPMKRETFLDVFESVNAGYSWQRMPLRPDEIKNGLRKLTYNGKPILIGDFNLDRVLSKLEDEGLVKEEAGYYGLARWEKESRRSIHYLALYRILRNVFVNNAVRFSKLDAMEDCDMKAIAGKEEIYLHVMEEPREGVVHRALATARRGTTIIAFKTPEERDAFRASLTSTSRLAVALKMEVDGDRIMLLTAKNEVSAYLKGTMR